jgi:hypothetical protein
MQIHRDVSSLIDAGASRAYIASKFGFLKGVKVGAPDLPIHGFFMGRVDRPKDLEDIDPQIVLLNHVPVPAHVIAKAKAIFEHVYHKHEKAEMIVLLRWRVTDLGNGRKIGEYYLDRAERVEVAAGGLDYIQHVPIVGSIHSHGDFGAGFSSVDDRWEKDDTPGIYITLGNVGRKVPSIETSIGGLGTRRIVEAPEVPEAVFESVKLTKTELDWWTETLVVKRYSRATGFYVCCGSRITGWVGTKSATKLRAGERFVSVAEYKKPEPITLKPIPGLAPLPAQAPGRRPPARTAATVSAALAEPLPKRQEKRIAKFLAFLRDKDIHSEFMERLLATATDPEIDAVVNIIDMSIGFPADLEREELWQDQNPGTSSLWDAAGLDTTSGKQWDEYFRQ